MADRYISIFVIVFAIGVWLLWLAAIASMVAGNPTAVNAVIGIPVPGIPLAVAAIMLWRNERKT